MSMPLRTSPIPLPPSSAYNQSTPALHSGSSNPYGSSSPPTDVIATPSDHSRFDGLGRRGLTKGGGAGGGVGGGGGGGNSTRARKDHLESEMMRRGARARSSSGELHHLGSPESVQIGSPCLVEPMIPFEVTLRGAPPITKPLSSSSSGSLSSASILTGSRPTERRPRPALPPRPTPGLASNALAVAQANGISADQFEEAKQQFMRFLKSETAPPLSSTSSSSLVSLSTPSSGSTLVVLEEKHKPTASGSTTSTSTKIGNTASLGRSASRGPIAQSVNLGETSSSSSSIVNGSAVNPFVLDKTPARSTHTATQGGVHFGLTLTGSGNGSGQPGNTFETPGGTQTTAAPPSSSTVSSSMMYMSVAGGGGGGRGAKAGGGTTPSSDQVKSRTSLEDIVQRTADRTRLDEEIRKEREVRQWADESSSSSSSSSDEESEHLQNQPKPKQKLQLQKLPSQDHHHDVFGDESLLPPPASSLSLKRIQTSDRDQSSKALLLPSPNFSSGGNDTSVVPGKASRPNAGIPIAKRGMMERFMCDRAMVKPSKVADSSQNSVKATPERATRKAAASEENMSSRRASASRTPVGPPRPVPTNSPKQQQQQQQHQPQRSTGYSPNTLLTSPAPSTRGDRPGVLFSPDVARLLRSELDELEANEVASRRQSPRRAAHDRANDIAVEDTFSSPFCVKETPTSNRKRSHELSSSEDVTHGKRSRWASANEEIAVSPTPSTSLSLRAPSFCDSSPANSDGASTIGGGGRHTYHHANTHPASAPDFMYSGPPSSSPSSSHHSFSESFPVKSRSSPGPAPRKKHLSHWPPPSSIMIDSNQVAGTAAAAVAAAAAKRAPLKRAETSPAILGPDGSAAKPSWSYAALIGQAIFSTDDQKISLADIYQFIMTCYPYYKKEDSGWQNSIRHNLSLNDCFVKTARGVNNPGKGCLWAIVKGCEDQFADGGFTKKGSGSGRKSKTPKSGSRYDPTGLLRSNNGSGAKDSSEGDTPTSSRAGSPTASPDISTALTSAPSSATSIKEVGARPPSKPTVVRHTSALNLSMSSSPLAPSSKAKHNVLGELRATKEKDAVQNLPPTVTPDIPVIEEKTSQDKKRSFQPSKDVKNVRLELLAPPYQSRPAQTRTASAIELPVRQPPTHVRRRSLTSPLAASPPTSVYHRLAAPYQPISYSQSSAHNHRALALLASPEASGIMPVHPSVYDHHARSMSPPIQQRSERDHSHFLPAPQIFPSGSGGSGGGRRQRSRSEEKEERAIGGGGGGRDSMTLVHTQSPISSIRGGPRAPMSPLQAADDKLSNFSADPEKKRASGLRHLPAVSALVDASETFRTPPRHIRSPSTRSLASMATPRNGRWGASPGMGDGAWGWGDPFGGQVEAELERFGGRDGDSIQGSGSSSVLPRLYWPSPSAASAATHMAW